MNKFYFFCFSSDYKNWNVLYISTDLDSLIKKDIPELLSKNGIKNRKTIKSFIDSIVAYKECNMFVNEYYKLVCFNGTDFTDKNLIIKF